MSGGCEHCAVPALLFFHWIIDYLWSRLCHKTISGCHRFSKPGQYWTCLRTLPKRLQPASTGLEYPENRIGKPCHSNFLVFVELWLVWDGKVSHGQCHCKQRRPRGPKVEREFRCTLLQEELVPSHPPTSGWWRIKTRNITKSSQYVPYTNCQTILF